MPMQGAATLQEYLISLGVQMDTGAMSQLMSFLSSGKVKAAAMGAAFTAAGKAIYRFLKSSYDAEQEMQKLARTQHKSVETIRAQQNALKAMGKTMQEVSKDPALKAMYNDLVKANKAMALPDMRGGISLLRQLQASFYELRAAVRYSMQWINYHMLANLKEPIQRITAFFKQVAEFIRKDINGLTAKLASYLTAFTKGLLGIVEMSVKIADWVHKLPDGIKSAGLAVTAVFALLKSGPLGQIMAVITAVGGLIDDYENWKWNKANPDAEQVAVAFPSIWDLLDSDDPEKMSKISGMVFDAITGGADDFAADLPKWVEDNRDKIIEAGKNAGNILASAIDLAANIISGVIGAAVTLASDPAFLEACANLGVSALQAMLRGVVKIGGSALDPIMKLILGENSDEYADYKRSTTALINGIVNPDSPEAQPGVDENGHIFQGTALTALGYSDEEVAAMQARYQSSAKYRAYTGGNAKSSGLDAGVRRYSLNGAPAWSGEARDFNQLYAMLDAAETEQEAEYLLNTIQQYAEMYNAGKTGLLGLGANANTDSLATLFASATANITNGTFPGVEIPTTVPDDAGADILNTLQTQVNHAGMLDIGISFTDKSGAQVPVLGTKKNAWGGRYDRPITTEVAEDGGTEYIIPLSKPARAFSLIKQMLGEMGNAATQRLMTDMGLGMAGTNGASAATISAAASGATINNTYNISAPVTIQVTASGADAKEIGTTAYNAAQRQLIRSLKGVLA
nr:MAG TPA: hypothetical protein [Caudoviricetes sp.]